MNGERYYKKNKMTARAFDIMNRNGKYCNDNTHLLCRKMFKERFRFKLTLEQIKFINSVDRCRRRVFKDHPHLDNRKQTRTLGKSDGKYYAQA